MSIRLIQDLHAGISRRDWNAVEAAANRLRDDVEETRRILAGTGIGSLPNDYPLSRLATEAKKDGGQEVEAKPICHLVWRQGRRAIDDVEDYYEVARPGDKSVDGSDPFPVFAQPASTALVERLAERFDRIATIIDRNLYHQHEKIEDAKSIAVQMREELRAIAAQPEISSTVSNMTTALDKCQKALAAMIDPSCIAQTTVINAFAMATEAEASARAALSASQSTSRKGESRG